MNLCAPHYSAKKSGGDIEEGVAAFNEQAAQYFHRRYSDRRAERNNLWQEAISEMTDNALDGGFSAYLASCISVVANVKNFNTVKDVEGTCLVHATFHGKLMVILNVKIHLDLHGSLMNV